MQPQGDISHQSFSLVDWLRKQHPSSHFCSLCPPVTSPSHLMTSIHRTECLIHLPPDCSLNINPPTHQKKKRDPLKAKEIKQKLPEFHVSIYFFCFPVHAQSTKYKKCLMEVDFTETYGLPFSLKEV